MSFMKHHTQPRNVDFLTNICAGLVNEPKGPGMGLLERRVSMNWKPSLQCDTVPSSQVREILEQIFSKVTPIMPCHLYLMCSIEQQVHGIWCINHATTVGHCNEHHQRRISSVL